jgi:hypothetical protein
MRVLIVYDTVSSIKLTAKVAETIGRVLKEKGIDTDSFSVKDVDKAIVKNYDCLVAGSPTMYLRASKGICSFLMACQARSFLESEELGANCRRSAFQIELVTLAHSLSTDGARCRRFCDVRSFTLDVHQYYGISRLE